MLTQKKIKGFHTIGNLAVETKESAEAIIFEHEETKYSAEEKEIQMSEPQIEVFRQKSQK